jgi:hypothetical protein
MAPGAGSPLISKEDTIMRRFVPLATALFCALLVFGCSGDYVKTLMSNPESQAKILDAITANSDLAGKMVDKLVGNDDTRKMILAKIMADSGTMQTVVAQVAKDPQMVETVITTAVQDPALKTKIMDMVKGMAKAKK